MWSPVGCGSGKPKKLIFKIYHKQQNLFQVVSRTLRPTTRKASSTMQHAAATTAMLPFLSVSSVWVLIISSTYEQTDQDLISITTKHPLLLLHGDGRSRQRHPLQQRSSEGLGGMKLKVVVHSIIYPLERCQSMLVLWSDWLVTTDTWQLFTFQPQIELLKLSWLLWNINDYKWLFKTKDVSGTSLVWLGSGYSLDSDLAAVYSCNNSNNFIEQCIVW